jgi:outer membrane receptor for ferrienterochelin and colicins
MIRCIVILLFLLPLATVAQRVTGRVINIRQEPLIGATIYWLGAASGTRTNKDGSFELKPPRQLPAKLVASYVEYQPDTLTISKLSDTTIIFQLQEKQDLSEVIIESQRSGIILSDLSPIKVEQITQTELRKSACCDLAGCFETQTTVQPQTTNVVTNAKELRILGLSGVYNQILLDGFPVIQGLTYTYGISSVPGTTVSNIYVAKGANSVLQGFESISGQINVETKEPDNTDRLLLNGYINSFGEKHLNSNYAIKKNKWSNLTAFHMVQPAGKIDRDQDNFLDLPLLTRYLLMNKWKYGNEKSWGWHSRVGIRLLQERRIGGQTAFDPVTDKGSTSIYGQAVSIQQPEIWTKTGYRFNDKHSVTGFFSSFFQQQRSYFGTVRYLARQANAYLNLQYELNYLEHQLKTGVSFRYLRLNEDINFTDQFIGRSYDGNYRRYEKIPGVFAENTLRLAQEKITWIVGIRGDHHNQFGFQVTPRSLIKYDITPSTIVRANIGTGWRTVNLFSENIGLLVSSRDILFAEALLPERALNMGINITKKFQSASQKLSGHVSVDFYRTSFQNQIFPDYDSDPTKAIIKNFTGKSISNGLQTELLLHMWNTLELKTGYNFLDVFRITQSGKQLLPFNPRQKLLTTISYRPTGRPLQADANIHWYGKQRLPDTKSNPVNYQRPDFSNPYTVVNFQLTYGIKSLEVYSGVENVFDFRQRQPIISWQDPFSPFFDTSSVWGPTRGREIYIGIRFKLKEKTVP